MLPKVLQNMIDSLMKDNVILSWNIRGEEDTTHVNIRFSTTKMADNVTYKKAPPSRIARDRKRLTERIGKNGQSDNNDSDVEMISSPQDHRSTTRPHHFQNKPSEPAKNTEDSPKPTNIVPTPNPQQAKSLPVTTLNYQQRYMNGRQGTHVNKPLVSKQKQDRSDICYGCELVFEDEESIGHLYQCIACGDVFLCQNCKSKDIHNEHQRSIIHVTRRQYFALKDRN